MTATAEDDDAPPRWRDDLYAGIKRTMTIGAMAEIPAGARLIREGNGTAFVAIRVAATPPPKFKRNLDPSSCRDRFRAALLS
jgi:hypothetical protein